MFPLQLPYGSPQQPATSQHDRSPRLGITPHARLSTRVLLVSLRTRAAPVPLEASEHMSSQPTSSCAYILAWMRQRGPK